MAENKKIPKSENYLRRKELHKSDLNYCEFCSPREYFENEESIVKQHLLDGVLKWCNEHLDHAKGIYFSSNPEWGIYWASLVSENGSLEKIKPDQYVAF